MRKYCLKISKFNFKKGIAFLKVLMYINNTKICFQKGGIKWN